MSGRLVMWAKEDEVEGRLSCSVVAVGAIGSVGAFDSEEVVVEWEVTCSELDQCAGLVPSKLACDVHVIV